MTFRKVLNHCRVPLCAAPLLLWTLSGCTSDYGGPINGQRALSPEEMRLQATETKLTEVSRRLNAMEAAQQNGQSSEEMRGLRGQVEQLRNDVDQLQQKSADLDQRLKRFEGGGAQTPPPDASGAVGSAIAPPVGGPPPVEAPPPASTYTPPPPPPLAAAAPSTSADEEAIYLRSFDLLKAGKYPDAIRGFQGMLAKYPQGNYADNAWYWMGESYYVTHDYPNALKSYQSLLRTFPASPKVPDALLKTGAIYQDQQQKEQARAAFERIVKAYPASSAAAQARTRLSQLK